MSGAFNDPWSQFRYKTFISYSHQDQEFAAWLEQALEAFATPRELRGRWTPIGPVPANLKPVFRDRSNLSAGHDLSEELKSRLAESAALIVVCSPGAALSTWVEAEIRHFRELGRGDRIFAIIADGVAAESPPVNCFPVPFLEDEPIAANANPPEAGGEGRENALIKLIAGIMRVDPTDLREKENAVLAARARNARILAAVFGVIALGAIASAAFAFTESMRANRSIAVAQKTIDGVIETLESDQMQNVWGFQSVEADLIEQLLQLQTDLGDDSQRDAIVATRLSLRMGALERARGNVERSTELYEQGYRRILPVALEEGATEDQRVLALEAAYRYFRALGVGAQSAQRASVLEETKPILDRTRADGMSQRARRWVAWWYDNQRLLSANANDYATALESAEQALEIARIGSGESDATIEDRIDLAMLTYSRSQALRGLSRRDDAVAAAQESCALNEELYREAPAHRLIVAGRIDCAFDAAQRRFDRRDRAGALAAIAEGVAIAQPAATVNREDASFRAALATARYRVGEVQRWLDNDVQAAIASYEQSLAIWGEIYGANAVQPSSFNNLEATFNALRNALDAAETAQPDDQALRARNAERLLSIFSAFESCADRLGGSSTCGRVVAGAVRSAADRLFRLERAEEVLEPLRVAAALTAQLESDPAYQRYSDTFAESCAFRRDVGRALTMTGQGQEALAPLREAITLCVPFMQQHDYDIYVRSAVVGAHLWLSRAERAAGQPEAARRTLELCYGLHGANCYSEYAEVLEQGIGGAANRAEAARVRAQRAYTNMKRFTIPVRAPGSEVTFPFYVYIFERPPNFPYRGIDDQLRWLEVNRGLEAAPEIGDSFRRLEEIAINNDVSFPDLAVYAVSSGSQ